MKALIFDSGPLINLSMNGLLEILEKLKSNFDGKFFITNEVKREVLDRPINIHRFELGALRIKKLLDSGVLELPKSIGIENNEIKKETDRLTNIMNKTIKVEDQWINLVSEAEISCMALSEILSEKKISSMIVIDERTARTICEKPENLERIMSKKLHKPVKLANPEIRKFQKKFRFIRSPEIVFVAYKKNLIENSDPKILEAMLYATKYKGSSITFEEIDVLKRL